MSRSPGLAVRASVNVDRGDMFAPPVRILVLLLLPLLVVVITANHGRRHRTNDAQWWERLSTEIDSYDYRLGQVLHRELLSAWRSAAATVSPIDQYVVVGNAEPKQVFFRQYNRWATKRYRQFCTVAGENSGDICRYLNDVRERFAQTGHDGFPWPMIHDLGRRVARLSISHRGRHFVCDESLEQQLARIDDPVELGQIFAACQQRLVDDGIPERFEEIRRRITGVPFQRLWPNVNADLGVERPEWALWHAIALWNRVKPFYQLLFEFVRHRLWHRFGPSDHRNELELNDTVPLHWLRSLIGTRWYAVKEVLMPHQNIAVMPETWRSSAIDLVVDFYRKLGFPALPDRFWRISSIVADGRTCHPFAMAMVARQDARINICLTNDTVYDMRRFFHELGHIYYYQARGSGRNLYLDAGNSAAHEAIGEVVRLLWNGCRSANATTNDRSARRRLINQLMEEAITSFVLIPYGVSLELWRHRTFNNMANQTLAQLQDDYWRIRRQVQGFRRPEAATDHHDRQLYPLLKYHVSNFIPYLRYVFGTVLMHQFHRGICHRPGPTQPPLAECCPHHPNHALNLFRTFLQIDLRSSRLPAQHQQVLRHFFQSSSQLRYDPQSLLDYYQPLIQWLQQWKQRQMDVKL